MNQLAVMRLITSNFKTLLFLFVYNIISIYYMSLGLKFKTGFEIKRGMNMGVYYEMGLTDINPQFVQTYNKVFGVSVSYLFSITQEDKYNRYPDYYHY